MFSNVLHTMDTEVKKTDKGACVLVEDRQEMNN